jgi:ribosomal protein L24E
MRNLITCLVVCVLSGVAVGDILTVDDDGLDFPKADYDNIQDAVDASSDGDEIVVMPGIYYGDGKNGVVDMHGKIIILRSQEGAEVTYVDGEDLIRCFYLNSGEGQDTIIDGFTIQNGNADSIGGGMRNFNSSPTVRNCIFKNNIAVNKGGGMFNSGGSSPIIENCRFENNSDSQGGGGIYNREDNNNPQISNTTLCGNTPENIYGTWTDLGGNELLEFCPTTWTVDDDGKVDFDNIQAAVDAANNGDEIVVMPGTYTGTGNEVVDMDGKEIWLHSSKGAQVTIINGEDARRGIYCGNNETSNTIIEGFTITNGDAWVGSSPQDGGGIRCENSSPTITNCIISDNLANYGGGIECRYSSPKIINCTISNNTAINGGGGFRCDVGDSNPTLENCIFENNTAINGGGMFNLDSSSGPSLTNCIFTGNTASNNGGGMYNLNNSTTLTNCTFTGNTASGNLETEGGGGMYNINSNPTLTNCTFTNNTSGYGGGMKNQDSSPTVTDCTFENNTATVDGGGGMANWHNSSPAIENTTFTGNSGYNGGALRNDFCSPTLTNCLFTENTASGSGAGMWNHYSNATFINCIFENNTAAAKGGVMCSVASELTLTNCILRYNISSDGGGLRNIDESGITCTAALTDTTVCGNLPDQIVGTWIDNGGNTLSDECPICPDVNSDGIIDPNDIMAIIWAWGTCDTCSEDLNDDGMVNLNDLMIVIDSWGMECL